MCGPTSLLRYFPYFFNFRVYNFDSLHYGLHDDKHFYLQSGGGIHEFSDSQFGKLMVQTLVCNVNSSFT